MERSRERESNFLVGCGTSSSGKTFTRRLANLPDTRTPILATCWHVLVLRANSNGLCPHSQLLYCTCNNVTWCNVFLSLMRIRILTYPPFLETAQIRIRIRMEDAIRIQVEKIGKI